MLGVEAVEAWVEVAGPVIGVLFIAGPVIVYRRELSEEIRLWERVYSCADRRRGQTS